MKCTVSVSLLGGLRNHSLEIDTVSVAGITKYSDP